MKKHSGESFGYREINGKTGLVSPSYLPLQNELFSRPFYQAYFTFDINPDDRYKRRLWYENIQLYIVVGVYVHQRKNFLVNLTYVWRVPKENEGNQEHLIETLNGIKKTITKDSTVPCVKNLLTDTPNLTLKLLFSQTSTTDYESAGFIQKDVELDSY